MGGTLWIGSFAGKEYLTTKHLPKNFLLIWAETGGSLSKEAFLKECREKILKFGGYKMVYVQCFIKEKKIKEQIKVVLYIGVINWLQGIKCAGGTAAQRTAWVIKEQS